MKIEFKGFLGIAVLMMFLGTGCATNRGILDVRVPETQNPTEGKSVTIAKVTDCRVFQEAPPSPSIPSLKGEEIKDPAITSRAIARKRNGYGKAIGDILLPEGRGVEDLVKEALVKSFRESGYRVIDDSERSTGGEKSVPIEADIEQFWSWFTPGFWTCSLEFEAKVKIKGDVSVFREGETVRGYVLLHTQAATGGAWMNAINKGMDEFIEEVKKRLLRE